MTTLMLPNSHRQCYQEFKQALEELQVTVSSDRSEGVQRFFQERVASLTADGIDPSLVSRWQSVQTEMHKQMRLLTVDLTFFQASRQLSTREQRQKQIVSRLQTLIGYCEVLVTGET
ncbi:MAG: heterocyst frequency control protein PatD [Hormoscilla sp. GM7CHS1pb]|nr:heterocyst frequency control protein PatD [Hormoscilla sp. GM7CHS1pb]